MLNDILEKEIKKLPTILSIQETANFFSVAYLTVYRLIRKGKLPAWKDEEGNWCVARKDLEEFCFLNQGL